MHKVCPGPKWIYLLQRGIYTGLVYVCNTILIYEWDKADTSYYKSLSPVTWKDGLMLMNVIRLICGPFSDSTISKAALANPPTLLFHLVVLLEEKIKVWRSHKEFISDICEHREPRITNSHFIQTDLMRVDTRRDEGRIPNQLLSHE